MYQSSLDKNQIIKIITCAFQGVQLGKGIGLWQGQAIDNYEINETQAEASKRDEILDWTKIPIANLNTCEAALSYFDAEGMRFHIPAFMISEINGTYHYELLSVIAFDEHSASYRKAQFEALNQKQRESIIVMLKWCLANPGYDYHHDDIRRTLDEYWDPKPGD